MAILNDLNDLFQELGRLSFSLPPSLAPQGGTLSRLRMPWLSLGGWANQLSSSPSHATPSGERSPSHYTLETVHLTGLISVPEFSNRR